jgi:MscS family membrane protein
MTARVASALLILAVSHPLQAPADHPSAGYRTELVQNPLNPPDTSSPRAALSEFLRYMNASYRLIKDAHADNQSARGLKSSESVKKKAQLAEELFEKGIYCLDMSKVPTAFRTGQSYDSALKLKEILDRIDLPALEEVPDLQDVEQQQADNVFDEAYRWRIPGTDIFIERIGEGPRQGQFLFSSVSIARLSEFYAAAQVLEYRPDRETSPRFYEFYIATPGNLLPPKWSQWLPEWSEKLLLDQTIWQWFALVLFIMSALAVVVVLQKALKPQREGLPALKKHLRKILIQAALIMISLSLYRIISHHINLTGKPLYVLGSILTFISWLAAANVSIHLGKFIAESIILSPGVNPNGIQASYYRAVFGLSGILTGAAILVYGLSSVGVALAPLLAGVGIGGLAIALAARPSLENIIGSFTIFADHPYRVGQRIKALGQDGFVEAIGLRSTRIRLLSGHLTTIPNEKMISAEIENIGERPYIRRKLDLALKLGTPPAKLNRAVEIIRNILALPDGPDAAGHPNTAINDPNFPPRVFFDDIRRDAMNILILYWYAPPNRWEYLEHAHWINVQILEQFSAEGIRLALPAQSLAVTDEESFAIPESGESASAAVRPDQSAPRNLADGRSDTESEGTGK